VIAGRSAVNRRDQRQQKHRGRGKDVERDDIGYTEELRHKHQQNGPHNHVPHAAKLGIRTGQHLCCSCDISNSALALDCNLLASLQASQYPPISHFTSTQYY